MTTNFTSLPIVDLAPLSSANPTELELKLLADRLHDVFATVGFAYLVNHPLTFSHDDVFRLAREFFEMRDGEKMSVAKKTFTKSNKNTYRGCSGVFA